MNTLDQKLETLSDKYKLVETKQIAQKFKERGFLVDSYTEVKVRKASRKGYQKHMVRLSNPNLLATNHDDLKLQLLVTNSHDGLSSFKIQLGFFRMVCSNGMVVGKTFDSIALRHTGLIIEEIDQAIDTMVAQCNKLSIAIQNMKDKTLTDSQIKTFFEKAIKLRSDKIGAVSVPLVRDEDEGTNVYVLYNRVQELLVNGGSQYTNINTSKKRKLKALKSIDKVNDINAQLFDLAMQYTEEKQVA